MPGEGETNNLCTTLWNTGARPDGRHDPAGLGGTRESVEGGPH